MMDYEERKKAKRDREPAREGWRQSQGIYHAYGNSAKEEKKPVAGLRQKEENRTEEKELHQIFRMGNAYGNVSIGMNDKSEFALVVNREKNEDATSLKQGQRELNEAFGSVYPHRDGKQVVNSDMKQTGAFTYQMYAPEHRTKRVMRGAREFQRKYGQETLAQMIPFLNMEREKGELREREEAERGLRMEKASASAQRKAAADTEEKRQELAKKKQMQHEMMHKMNQAIGVAWRSALKKEKDAPVRLMSAAPKKEEEDGQPQKPDEENKK